MTLFVLFRVKKIKNIRKKQKTEVLPLKILDAYLEGRSIDAKKSYIKRLCQKKELIRIKNGLYLFGEDYRKNSYSLFELANYIEEPSYISLESALSHYGLIPEAVYTTTSVTTRTKSDRETPVGNFSFEHLKSSYFNFGFYQADDEVSKYLIATPLKALMDYIVLRKKKYENIEEVKGDLRLDFDEFKSYQNFVNKEKIDEYLKVYKSYRLQVILKDIRKNL